MNLISKIIFIFIIYVGPVYASKQCLTYLAFETGQMTISDQMKPQAENLKGPEALNQKIPKVQNQKPSFTSTSLALNRGDSFLRQVRKDSRIDPTGVELEVDLESVYEHLVFSPKHLKWAALEFCELRTLRNHMFHAIKEEMNVGLFDSDVQDEIITVFRKWLKLAFESKNGTVQPKVYELAKILIEDDDFAATILKVSLLKILTQSIRRDTLIQTTDSVKSTLLNAFPEIIVSGDKLFFKLKDRGVLDLALDSIFELYSKLSIEDYLKFVENVSLIIKLQKARDILGVNFLDPQLTSMDTSLMISAPGQLYFLATIEDRNPSIAVPYLTSGIELHAISSSTPSTTRRLLNQRLQDISDVPSLFVSSHFHVVAPVLVPSDEHRTSPLNPMLMRLEHGRRLEMIAHMTSVVVYNQPIEHRGPSFAPMKTSDVAQFFDGFPEYWYENKAVNYLHKDRANGYVSFTGPGNYKPLQNSPNTPSIFGYEFRFLKPEERSEENPDFLSYLMDDAKYFLHQLNSTNHATTLPPRFQKYFEKFLKRQLEKVILSKSSNVPFSENLSYQASKHAARALFEAAYYLSTLEPSEKHGFYTSPIRKTTFNFRGGIKINPRNAWINAVGDRKLELGYEVGFIYHNWERDPLFFDSPEQLRKIKLAQDKATRRLSGSEPTLSIVKDFLLESGIFEIYQNSLRVID